MSGLCKVEMSGFMGGRGRHGNGANGLESTRTKRNPALTVAKARYDPVVQRLVLEAMRSLIFGAVDDFLQF
jgi:hypothetical protein